MFLSKEERINQEIERLKEVFESLPDVTVSLLDGMIKRAAYMRITLEDYEADLDSKGIVEMFTQSERTPPYERERPVARLYNSMNRNYQSLMKQLIAALPDETSVAAVDEIKEFLAR